MKKPRPRRQGRHPRTLGDLARHQLYAGGRVSERDVRRLRLVLEPSANMLEAERVQGEAALNAPVLGALSDMSRTVIVDGLFGFLNAGHKGKLVFMAEDGREVELSEDEVWAMTQRAIGRMNRSLFTMVADKIRKGGRERG